MPKQSPKSVMHAASALLGALLVSVSGAALAQTVESLPVYHVVAAGVSPDQVSSLATSLNLPPEQLTVRGGAVRFIDRDRFAFVPRKFVGGANAVDESGQRLQAIDVDALRLRTVPSDDLAVKRISAAFTTMGLNLLSAAQPSVGHTRLSMSYLGADGHNVALDQPLDTRVSYGFVLADHYPLVGPGAQASATLGPEGTVTHLHLAVRELRPGEQAHIIPEADMRARVAEHFGPGVRMDTQLVYWAPSLETGPARSAAIVPTTVIPWWSVSVAVPHQGSGGKLTWIRSKTLLVPATDDARFVPSAKLSVSGENASHVDASVVVSGGRAPYTLVWAGSDPSIGAQSGTRISYTPIFRGGPDERSPKPATETLSVTVFDANGVSAEARQTFDVIAQPAPEDHPVVEDKTKGDPGTYGTESPREPDFAIDRVGWQNGMAHPGGGSQRYAWLGNQTWPGDFVEPTPKGTYPANPAINGDADYSNYGINTANIVLNNTDGGADGFDSSSPGATIKNYATAAFNVPADPPIETIDMVKSSYVGATQTANVSVNRAWGTWGPNDHLLWLIHDACDTLDLTDGSGLAPWDRWGPMFDGLHILLGWDSTEQVGDGSFEQDFAENMVGASGSPQQILQAWFNSANTAGVDHGLAAALGPIGPNGVTNQGDYYSGLGSTGTTIRATAITGWWFIYQTAP
jgi:Family of unknown function (DUF6345)